MTTYSERLSVPLRWWVQATMFLATLWLAFVVALPGWLAWTAALVLLGLVYGWFLLWGSVRIVVDDGVLHAGPARIPTGLLGPAEPLDKEATRRVHGVDADARAFLVTRPYLHRAVRIPVEDPADPTPYWLVSSRHPGRLVEVLRQEREGRRQVSG
ncbi:MAG TPA: DUF3093 domain-containing protein [Marmoricola sp.]|jgi:hypothetical protein|nr:DUF3093 domain-containing protein [Marmoricola sp.]